MIGPGSPGSDPKNPKKSDDDPPFEEVLHQLARHSRSSLIFVVIGAVFLVGSVYYSATRLSPLEAEIGRKRAEINRLAQEETAQRQRLADMQRQYETLKASTEQLYAVRVTPGNAVYELKATAQATGEKYRDGKPIYNFSVYVKSPQSTLESIRSVHYRFDHDTFRQKEYVSKNRAERFAVSYTGWGCLGKVDVTVSLVDGTEQEFDFNMCRSLGPQWD